MNKTCARCERVVYPPEQFNVMGKTFHKGCFRCTECGTMLNLCSYQTYNKLPYCCKHLPKIKASYTVADSVEYKRIAQNNINQSQFHYQAEFERNKGKPYHYPLPQKVAVAEPAQHSTPIPEANASETTAVQQPKATVIVLEEEQAKDEDEITLLEASESECEGAVAATPPPLPPPVPSDQTLRKK